MKSNYLIFLALLSVNTSLFYDYTEFAQVT
jgi:hypothetical protein